MKTQLITAPDRAALSTDTLKDHLRITSDSEDAYLSGLCEVATARAEDLTGQKFINQAWRLYLDQWPAGGVITLPFGTLQSVTSIKYKDQAGDESTVDAATYLVDPAAKPGRIVLAYNQAWPTATLYESNPIYIDFITGFGAGVADIPAPLRQAMLLLAAHYYESREPIVVGTIVSRVPETVDALLWPYRFMGF